MLIGQIEMLRQIPWREVSAVMVLAVWIWCLLSGKLILRFHYDQLSAIVERLLREQEERRKVTEAAINTTGKAVEKLPEQK